MSLDCMAGSQEVYTLLSSSESHTHTDIEYSDHQSIINNDHSNSARDFDTYVKNEEELPFVPCTVDNNNSIGLLC